MDNKAITAGVRIGGLNDRTQIKILLCYLLATIDKPITDRQFIERVCGQELVNYFEMRNALAQLCENGMIEKTDAGYVILPEGKDVARQLEDDVPGHVKKYAYNMVVALLQYDALKKQNKVEIIPTGEKEYTVRCKLEDENFSIFSMDIHMPDKSFAEKAAQQFILSGRDMFKVILGMILDSPDIYKDALKDGALKKPEWADLDGMNNRQ